MPRAKPTRPTKKMRVAAIAALHDAVTDSAVPPYAKIRAATALLGADRAESVDDRPARDPDAPRIYTILPDNGRNSNVRYGLHDEAQTVVIVPAGYPCEIQPESFYAGVPKPADRLSRNRPMMLAAPELFGDDGE
jgi:hypothetical protein